MNTNATEMVFIERSAAPIVLEIAKNRRFLQNRKNVILRNKSMMECILYYIVPISGSKVSSFP